MGAITIALTWGEVLQAAQVGVMRQVQNLKAGTQDRHGASLDRGWQLHIEGAIGELAVAKYRDRFWSGALGNWKADDVGRWQVRSRNRPPGQEVGDLTVHPSDPDDRPFVFVTGWPPAYTLHGFIMGRDAKKDEWWRDPAKGRPAFFVPTSALRDLSELKEAS